MAEKTWIETLISKASEIFHIVLTILGIAIVLLGLAGGVTYNKWLPIPDLNWRLAVCGLGVLVMCVGLYLTYAASNVSVPNPKDHKVSIDSPEKNDRVEAFIDVRGTINGDVPRGYKLWVRINKDGSMWPMRECSISQDRDKWEAFECEIGGKVGDKRGISVNFAGSDGRVLIKYLRQAMERHNSLRDELVRATGKPSSSYTPPLTEGTNDIIECHRVTVERV
jgi:hypothetical protein